MNKKFHFLTDFRGSISSGYEWNHRFWLKREQKGGGIRSRREISAVKRAGCEGRKGKTGRLKGQERVTVQRPLA
jgi:hypothetical protein